MDISYFFAPSNVTVTSFYFLATGFTTALAHLGHLCTRLILAILPQGLSLSIFLDGAQPGSPIHIAGPKELTCLFVWPDWRKSSPVWPNYNIFWSMFYKENRGKKLSSKILLPSKAIKFDTYR